MPFSIIRLPVMWAASSMLKKGKKRVSILVRSEAAAKMTKRAKRLPGLSARLKGLSMARYDIPL